MIDDNELKNIVGKYLLFTLGGESYGVGVLNVKEIIKMIEITPMPDMPSHIKGVVNLRGKIIPVVDLRDKFKIKHEANTDRTCIIVVMVNKEDSISKNTIGIVVDGVEEVANIKLEELEASPDFGERLTIDYLLGIAKLKSGVKYILDIDKVIAS